MATFFRHVQPIHKSVFLNIRDNETITGAGDPHIGEAVDLRGAPAAVGFKCVEPHEEDAGKIQSLDAVDGGDGDAVRGDVVGLLGPIVFGKPPGENPSLVEGSGDHGG